MCLNGRSVEHQLSSYWSSGWGTALAGQSAPGGRRGIPWQSRRPNTPLQHKSCLKRETILSENPNAAGPFKRCTAGEMPALRSGPQPREGRSQQSEPGAQPDFPVCARSPCKRHTPIQAGPTHPKSGKCLRECGGFMSRTAATPEFPTRTKKQNKPIDNKSKWL